MITRNNYELYIIDFYDGALNKVQVEELHNFLNQNPDLKAEFEHFSNTQVEAEPIVFTNKDSLKKVDTAGTERLIAYFENDLSGAERKKVEQDLKSDPKLAQELEIIRKTRVLPDYTILFANKSSLKKEAKIISFTTSFYRSLSIAASIILIAIAYFIFRPHRADEKMMADDKNKIEVPAKAPEKNKFIGPMPLADQNSTEANSNEKKESHLQKTKKVPSNVPSFADHKTNRKEETPVTPAVQQNVQPEIKLANEPKIDNSQLQLQIKEAPLAGNSPKPEESVKSQNQIKDLSGVFTPEELAELGIAKNVSTSKKESSSILDYAAEKIKRFSDSKDVSVANNANTFAVNVGKKFSVSHTSSK